MEDNKTSSVSPHITLEAITDNISDAIIIVDGDGKLAYMSSIAERLTGMSLSDAEHRSLFETFPDLKDSILEDSYRRVRKIGAGEKFEATFGRDNAWYSVNIFPLGNDQLCIAFHESSLNRRLEIISAGQREALSKALSGAPLEEVLEVLVYAVEQQARKGAVAAISLFSDDGDSLNYCVAPNLPGDLQSWLQGVSSDTGTTPCGLCAKQREPVAINDMLTQESWGDFTQRVSACQLHSCWCTPILSTEDKSVLGTFGLFYSESIDPVESDIQVIDALSQTAAIVIERSQENKARLRAESALSANTEILNKQRRLFETALSNTPDLLYIFDLQGRFTYANDALLEMWGKTWDEAVGKTCLELGYERWHADMHMREINQVIETRKPIRGDVPFTGTNGRRIYDYIFMPVIGEDGSVEAIAGSTRDVTERHDQEEMAKEAESRRRIALEASHSFGIWDWDIKNNIFTADERLGELFNLTPEQTTSGVPIELPLYSVHKDDIADIERAISESIEHGEPYKQEYRIVQHDGSIRWGSFRGRVLYDENNEPIRFPGVGVDVTREREAINALQEADQRKDEFLATLAHELRNPLAPISNALKIVQSDAFSDDKKREAFALVERQVHQMIRLVDDLMDVSRITRGKVHLNLAPVNICEVLDDALETVQPMIEERRHELQLRYRSKEIWVSGDALRLSQIFANIINNAAKYTEDEGVIRITVTESNGNAVITCADNGAGIPVEQLDNIFGMFSQVDSALERSHGGLGIGLTLVKRLTELHQGTITVESAGAGRGTQFSVQIPSISAPIPTSVVAPVLAEQSKTNIKVLIADDNQDAAITMGWLLEAKGCEVVVVEDGSSALQAVKAFTPDLVLLDIGMPGMNGYDLCIALRKNPALNNATFVAQTGWGQPAHIKRSQESGFHHHLVKPLNMSDLMPILEEVSKGKAQFA